MSDAAASEVERAASPVALSKKGFSKAQQAGIVGVGVAAIVMVIMMTSGTKQESHDVPADQLAALAGAGEDFKPPQPPAQTKSPADSSMPLPPQQPVFSLPSVGHPTDPLAAARQSDISAWSSGSAGSAPSGVAGRPAGPDGASGDASTPLGQRLQAARLEGARAQLLPHPDYTITMGTPIPCLPDQPINSELPGIVSCHVPRDVFGATGRVVLLDRGTKIVGQIQGGLVQGQNRLFVNWVRAETPSPGHVIITFNSPSADVIGEPGLEGDVSTHFWQRFGGAIMLSFLDAAFQAAVLAAQRGGNQFQLNTFQSSGQGVATEALQNTINIPPTLHRDQALPMIVFTARDLDFYDVYQLRGAN